MKIITDHITLDELKKMAALFGDMVKAVPAPHQWGTFQVEPFEEYYKRWPTKYACVPKLVVETWIYRHWREFQDWLSLRPLEWKYELKSLRTDEIMSIAHIGDWMSTLDFWGADLFDGNHRRNTWLGRYMLERGTTPTPIIIALNAGAWLHPREIGAHHMCEPYQLIEGHMRLAYLRGIIHRAYPTLMATHEVFVATLPDNIALSEEAKLE